MTTATSTTKATRKTTSTKSNPKAKRVYKDFTREIKETAAEAALEYLSGLSEDDEVVSGDLWDAIYAASESLLGAMPRGYDRPGYFKRLCRPYVKARIAAPPHHWGMFPRWHDNGFSVRAGTSWVIARELTAQSARNVNPPRAARMAVLYRNRAAHSEMSAKRISAAQASDVKIAKVLERVAATADVVAG